MDSQYKEPLLSSLEADVYALKEKGTVLLVPRARAKKDKSYFRAALVAALPPNSLISISAKGVIINPKDAEYLQKKQNNLLLYWSDGAEKFVENRVRIFENHILVKKQVDEIKYNGVTMAKELLKGIDLSILDDHQLINVAAMTIQNGFGACLFDEQGAGKTVTTVYAYDVLVERDEIDIALIIAPKSMVGEWPKDIQRFMGDLYNVKSITGTPAEKRVALSSGADIYITNYETVVSMEIELTNLLRRYRGRCILVVDESFFIKNKETKRAESLQRLREWAGRAFVLCGTPAPNSAVDLIGQFDFVDMGFTFKDIEIPDQPGEALRIIREAISNRGIYLRHLKKDVLPNLLPKNFRQIIVPLATEQNEIYTNALYGYVKELKATDDRAFKKNFTNFLAKRSALLQICSNPVSLVPSYTETPGKILALDEILYELISKRKEKVVLWSFYRKSLEFLMDHFQQYQPVRYDGTITSVKERQDAVRSFQEDPSVKLFIGNPAAAGAGLTLHRARYAIYESFSDQAAHYLQSLDRIHRRGQEREVEYIILLTSNTLEISQYNTLQRKEESSKELLGDQIEVHTQRIIMLDEALITAKALGLNI